MTQIPHPDTSRGARRSGGPHLGVLAIVSLALTLVGLLLAGLLSGGALLASPFVPLDQLLARYPGNEVAVRVGTLFQFGASVPLGIFAATLYARQLRLGVRVPGPSIAYFGGIAASLALGFSALVSWLLSLPDVWTDAALVRALAVLAFLLGGPAFAVGMGLLIAGAAVPALILRFTPAWLAWTGLVIAALAELSFLFLVAEPFQYLIPIARFGGGLWLIAIGFLLPTNRAARNAEVPHDA
ncbi:hypothetical protein ABCS02_20750 [Microbacterium sp. X-17]|uniref:hypothetical protein n=1 Tax=Microbacterium sp. X-17 TaxID=3144404 RepID=UPI0031F5D734